MRGGNPGSYPIEGKQSVFTHDMNKREFGCKQPNWDSKCT